MFALKKTLPLSTLMSELCLKHFVVFEGDEQIGVGLKERELDEGTLVTINSVGINGFYTHPRLWMIIGRSGDVRFEGTFDDEQELNIALAQFGLPELRAMGELR